MAKKQLYSPKDADRVRAKIQAGQLVNRLQDFATQKIDPVSNKPVHMSRDQITAATSLLRKVLPDLSNVEVQANVEGVVYTWGPVIEGKAGVIEDAVVDKQDGDGVICGPDPSRDAPVKPQKTAV